jgi:hypothetical protein
VSEGCILSNAIICNAFDLTTHCFVIGLDKAQPCEKKMDWTGFYTLRLENKEQASTWDKVKKTVFNLNDLPARGEL